MNYGKKAADLFREGYNCAQAVTIAFCDLTGLEQDYAARLSSSFGGGMGRLREVCGAVSGMLLVAGILYGYDSKTDDEAKKAHYALVQELAGKFKEEHGSIICRELQDTRDTDPTPTPRTEEYYKLRPCAKMVWTAAEILENYIAQHPYQ